MNAQDVQFETKRLHAAVRGTGDSPRALVEQVVQAVKTFADGRSAQDDIALVGFGRTV
jgi:serine phosphatase RsbU (regulator of sigma subunit)